MAMLITPSFGATPSFLPTSVWYAIITFLFMVLAGAVFEHISKLYMKLDFVNEENIKLLNGMHEGVLIMSKPKMFSGERELLFGNKSAFKVFKESKEDEEILH